jgi:hypothetical protein
MSHGELEKECAGLHAAVDILKQEEAQIKTDCELKLRRSKKIKIIALVTARGFMNFMQIWKKR